MAQLGSCCRIPSKVRLAYTNQYEWIMATPRSNSACTLGSQEVGKLSLPSFSSCCPRALPLSVAVSAATSIRRLGFMGTSGVVRSCTIATSGLLQSCLGECGRYRLLQAAVSRHPAGGHSTPALHACGGGKDYIAIRRFESAVPICWKVVTICEDDVRRKNLLASLAQFCSSVDV